MDLLEAFDALDVIAESAELTEGTSKWKSINLDLFESGENNALYITGAPGSGKSTLAKELSVKYGAKIIALDNSWLGGIVPGDDMGSCGLPIFDFLGIGGHYGSVGKRLYRAPYKGLSNVRLIPEPPFIQMPKGKGGKAKWMTIMI